MKLKSQIIITIIVIVTFFTNEVNKVFSLLKIISNHTNVEKKYCYNQKSYS